jgi:hypothetical protein
MTWLRPVDRTSGTLTLSAGTLSCLAHHGTPLSKRCPTTAALERTTVWHLAPRVSETASFPTLLSTASGLSGLVAGPLKSLVRDVELLSKAFQLASADGCATGLRTRSRHVYDFFRVLTV